MERPMDTTTTNGHGPIFRNHACCRYGPCGGCPTTGLDATAVAELLPAVRAMASAVRAAGEEEIQYVDKKYSIDPFSALSSTNRSLRSCSHHYLINSRLLLHHRHQDQAMESLHHHHRLLEIMPMQEHLVPHSHILHSRSLSKINNHKEISHSISNRISRTMDSRVQISSIIILIKEEVVLVQTLVRVHLTLTTRMIDVGIRGIAWGIIRITITRTIITTIDSRTRGSSRIKDP